MIGRITAIVIKEFRQKARGLSTIGVLTFVLGVIALVSYLILLSGYAQIESGFQKASDVGRNLAVAVLITQLILTAVFGLSFNGSAITQERDRETIDLLNLTLLGNAEIIIGKMMSSMLYIILLLFAGLPFFALSYTFGGWELSEILAAIAVEFSLVILVSSYGLLISVTSKDTRVALGRTFAVLIFGAVGTLYFGIRLLSQSLSGIDAFHKIMGFISLLLNPGFALWSILFPDIQSHISSTSSALTTLSANLPFWVLAAIFQLLVSMLAISAAIRCYKMIRQGVR
ncbi:ABC transporter permease subunit [bacterium]|nr:ABC transporter permease subunit [bacterium]